MAVLILTASRNHLLNQYLQTFIDNPSQNTCLRKSSYFMSKCGFINNICIFFLIGLKYQANKLSKSFLSRFTGYCKPVILCLNRFGFFYRVCLGDNACSQSFALKVSTSATQVNKIEEMGQLELRDLLAGIETLRQSFNGDIF